MTLALLDRYWPHILGVALVSLLLWKAYDFAYDNGVAATTAKYEKVIASFAKAEAEAQERARAAEQDKAAAVAKIAAQYEQGKNDAKVKADRVIADLSADRLRMRREWQGCETDRVSDSAATASKFDAEAELRRKGAGDLVRIGAEADEQVSGLQKVVIEDWK